ncbi:hypothetical protein PQX77_004377 [Marasmius sp. AFHP31]|nr:hypothetical protein PQX77_004377 [Marasmius sp. AFHP31]
MQPRSPLADTSNVTRRVLQLQWQHQTPIDFISESHDEPDDNVRSNESKNGIQGPRAKNTANNPRGRMSRFLDFPLDVIHEIFGQCEPETLIALTRVNRTFRAALLSNVNLWKDRRVECGIPAPLPGFSEPGWMKLLFGGARCQVCNGRNVYKVDFDLRKRICKECLRDPEQFVNLLEYSKEADPEGDPNVVARTWTNLVICNEDMYCRADEFHMALDGFERILLNPGFDRIALDSHPELLALFTQRKLEVRNLSNRIQQCKIWQLKWWTAKRGETRAARQARSAEKKSQIEACRREARTRLFQMGYTWADFGVIAKHKLISQIQPLTDDEWQDALPELLEKIGVDRFIRTSKAYNRRDSRRPGLAPRMAMVEHIYGRVKAKFPPAEYKSFKAFSSFKRIILLGGCGLTDKLLVDFPHLVAVFTHPDSVPVQQINFDGIEEEFEAGIEEYHRPSTD